MLGARHLRGGGAVKTLWLMRHASAANGAAGASDHDRELDPRGVAEAARMAELLERRAPAPSLVLCSSALRTVETLGQLRASLPDSVEVQVEQELYLASSDRLLRAISESDEEHGSLLLVAHNPGVAELAYQLVPSRDGEARARMSRGFAPGCLARLSMEGAWAEIRPGRARLLEFTRPGDLD